MRGVASLAGVASDAARRIKLEEIRSKIAAEIRVRADIIGHARINM